MTGSPYRAPLSDMAFALRGLDGFATLAGTAYAEVAEETLVGEIIAEAGRFAERKLAPLYHTADRLGVDLVQGRVRIPDEIRSAYGEFVAAGWPSLAGPVQYGGQGMPQFVALPVAELWRASNLAFALCPMLTSAAVEALDRHGDEALKRRFLAPLVSGEWTGTMNLTEPQAGSDLGLVQSLASPDGGTYRLKGRKIFITWGDHDLAGNILHFVLARTPDAPPGVKGLSLFLVPKTLVREDGTLGADNEVATVAVEHKLGIHGSPTCVLSYGERHGSVAYLVGERHAGLACMFTMMSLARVSVGVEGIGIAERAYQKAAAFARERLQGTVPGHAGPVPIISHGDVRRMLMIMKASLQAMRSVAYWGALNIDLAAQDVKAAARAELLTPLIKAWCTETAQEVVSLAMQVHGGVGYIEETGMAQLVRDARITTIYEGTTGIQANDFARRKLAGDDGAAARELLAELRAELASYGTDADLTARSRERFGAALDAAGHALDAVVAGQRSAPLEAGAAAVPALMCFGTLFGGIQLVRCVGSAARSLRLATGPFGAEYVAGQRFLAEFYADQILGRAQAHAAAAVAGGHSAMAMPQALF